MRETKKNIRWSGKIDSQDFVNILFDDLVIKKAKVINTKFKNTHFKNCYIGFDTTYSNCVFEKCKFYGKYSSFGEQSRFEECKFINCNFIGIDLFRDVKFNDCLFSGKMKNHILDGKRGEFPKRVEFADCDLSNIIFDNVSIYGVEIFINCILPNSGIRLFNNSGDRLIQRAKDICSRIETGDKIESEIIFKRDLMQGQNPIILDKLFLDSFFKTEDSKKVFNEIVNGYELNE